VCLRGRQYVLGRDQAEAYERFALLYRDVYGLQAGTGPPATVTELAAAWLQAHGCTTWNKYATRDLSRAGVGVRLAAIPPGLLEDFAAELRRRGNGPQTVRHKLSYAWRVLRWGVDREWVGRLPRRPAVPKPPRNPKDIPRHRLPGMLADMTTDRRYRTGIIVRFILATGCRPGEARALRWSQVDEQSREIRMVQHKTAHRTGRERVIYLGDEALEILREAREKLPTRKHVFCNNRGKPWDRRGLGRNLSRWCGVTPNQLRHTWAQHALDQTTREDVAKLLGHSGTDVVDVYCQVRDRRAHAVVRSITSPLS